MPTGCNRLVRDDEGVVGESRSDVESCPSLKREGLVWGPCLLLKKIRIIVLRTHR